MKRSFLQLAVAAAISALAMGVQAQAQYGAPLTPPSTPDATTYGTAPTQEGNSATQPGPSSSGTQAAADLRAAQAACNQQTGEARDACLRDAEKANAPASGESQSNSVPR